MAEEQFIGARWRVIVAVICSSVGIAVTRVGSVSSISGLSSEKTRRVSEFIHNRYGDGLGH